jgi:hypothetical protein
MPAVKTEKESTTTVEPYPTTKPKRKGPPMSAEVKEKLKALRADRKAKGLPTRIKRKKVVTFKGEPPAVAPA